MTNGSEGSRSPLIVDPKSAFGKHPEAAEHADVLVIGAGPAGVAAALEAARLGARVKLVDENPLSGDLIGMDVPLFFGGRAGPAVQNKPRMLEQVFAANPDLATVFEAGVDVALGTCAWGLFVNGPGLQTLPRSLVGLADETRAWLCSFDHLIVTAGARDLVASFAGSDQPGVMGALALGSLLKAYDAFAGRTVLMVGSGDLATATARAALDHGLEVAALVEVRPTAEDAQGASDLQARHVEVLTGTVIRAAERGPFGVAGAVLVGPDGRERRIACDTVCLAIDRVPAIELLEAAGAAMVFDGSRGGWVPRCDAFARTSLPGVFVAGDCAGLGPGSVTDAGLARAAGEAAARAALGGAPPEAASAAHIALVAESRERLSYRLDWMRALVDVGGSEVLACPCEDVTRGELLGVRPPRYLGAGSEAINARGLDRLLADGPLNQDQIKRLTRACMGACQARRCREQVAMLLAIGAGVDLNKVPLGTYRAPVRPLPLGLLGALEETAAMGEHWDVWFGIPTQWVPYEHVGTEREAEYLGKNFHV